MADSLVAAICLGANLQWTDSGSCEQILWKRKPKLYSASSKYILIINDYIYIYENLKLIDIEIVVKEEYRAR